VEDGECQTEIGAEYFERKSRGSNHSRVSKGSQKLLADSGILNQNSSTAMGSNALHGQSLIIDTSREDGLRHNTSLEAQ